MFDPHASGAPAGTGLRAVQYPSVEPAGKPRTRLVPPSVRLPEPSASGLTTMFLKPIAPVQRPRDGEDTKNVMRFASGVTFCEVAGGRPSRSAFALLQTSPFASLTVAVTGEDWSNSKPSGASNVTVPKPISPGASSTSTVWAGSVYGSPTVICASSELAQVAVAAGTASSESIATTAAADHLIPKVISPCWRRRSGADPKARAL